VSRFLFKIPHLTVSESRYQDMPTMSQEKAMAHRRLNFTKRGKNERKLTAFKKIKPTPDVGFIQVPHIRELSNQEIEDLISIYKLKSLINNH